MESQQCQNRRHGECLNRALPGKKYCNACDILVGTSTKTGQLKAYKIQRWRERVNELSEDTVTKSLSEEIGITRLTLEAIINSCETENALIMHSHRIGDLVSRVEKLISSCHRLEKSSGYLLDKGTILKVAGEIIGVVQRNVSDTNLVEKIANEIVDLISNTQNNDDDDK